MERRGALSAKAFRNGSDPPWKRGTRLTASTSPRVAGSIPAS